MVFRNASVKDLVRQLKTEKRRFSLLIGKLRGNNPSSHTKGFGTLNQVTELAPSLGTMVLAWLSALARRQGDDRVLSASHSKAENSFCTIRRDALW